ncbi:MAG: hypothetical protein JSU87_12135 [Gemmatimonadota bacterium]|nr:MAG: hypothetical protein JSU87_12135 [Gemmatimonadota bacterium]
MERPAKGLSLLLGALAVALAAACSEEPATAPDLSDGDEAGSVAPLITVSSPRRAAMLADGTMKNDRQTIVGEACAPAGALRSLTVNGETVRVSGAGSCQPFVLQQGSRWGLSIVGGRAEDEQGNTAYLAHSFLRSPSFFPLATEPSREARVGHAVFAQFNQEVIDDGDRSDIDDVATVASLLLAGVDLDRLIPRSLHAQPDNDPADGEVDLVTHDCGIYHQTNQRTGFRIRKAGAFTTAEVAVDHIDAVEGGLDVSLFISRPRLPVRVTGYLDLWCLGGPSAAVEGSLQADIIRADALLTIPPSANGTPLLTLESLDVDVGGFRSDVDLGGLLIIDFLLDELAGLFDPLFRDAIEDLLPAALEESLRPTIKVLLSEALLPVEIDIPLPTAARLKVESGLDWLALGEGYGQLGFYAQVIPTEVKSKPYDAALGSIQSGGAPPIFSASEYAVGLGLKDDLLNQVLWAAWQAGAFDLEDLGAYANGLGVDGIAGSTVAYLPPVVMPGRAADEIEIGIGDLYVEVTVGSGLVSAQGGSASGAPVSAGLYVSSIVSGSLAIDPATNALAFGLGRHRQVDVQVVAADDPAAAAVIRNIMETVMHDVLPVLLSDAIRGFALPGFDLEVIGQIPSGTVLELDGAHIDRRGSYHLLTGSLRQGSRP